MKVVESMTEDHRLAHALIHEVDLSREDVGDALVGLENEPERQQALTLARSLMRGEASSEDRRNAREILHPDTRTLFELDA